MTTAAATKTATKTPAKAATKAPEPEQPTEDTTPDETPEAVAPDHRRSIIEALTAVKREVRAVGKDSKAAAQLGGYSFRGIDAVVNAVAPALARHGIVVTPQVLGCERAVTQSRNGAAMMNVYVTMRYTFHGPAGDHLVAEVVGEAADAGDKAHSKAQSVAFRVALLQTLTLPTDDTDPDAEGYERAPAHQQPGPMTQAAGRPPQGQQAPPTAGPSEQVRQLQARWEAMPKAAKFKVQQLWGEAPAGFLPNGPMNAQDKDVANVTALFEDAERMASQEAQAQQPTEGGWGENPQ